jgi:hypothetical protein
MTYSVGSEAYNKFYRLPLLSYKCITYLIDNNELIWKLLKYNDADAWKDDAVHPNLTREEKSKFIYAGQEDESAYKVFSDSGQDNVWTEEGCLIRIYPYEIYPDDRTVGTINMMFEVYCHYKINHLSNYQTRSVTITQQFLETFNGADVGSIGKMFYDRRGSQALRTYQAGSIPFKGMMTLFSTKEV